ncbi:MAG: hypothetical protein ACYCVL_03450 [Gemmatimonadaceae bacterium]
MNYVELRTLRIDSVPASTTTGNGVLRHAADGRTVECADSAPYCYVYGSGSLLSSTPALQDLRVSAWGFGRGMRFYADVRGRAVVAGSTTLWPLANDHFDALEAYFELERPSFRVRAGRQWDVSGLQFNNYDGASVLLAPVPALNLEAYGGWALETGLDEPVTSGALAAVEPYAPESRGLLFGFQARARPVPALSLSAVYERQIAANRSGLYSERVATDGMLRGEHLSFDWAAQADLSTGDLNELRGQLLYTPASRVTVRAFARRHRPYFDLWTIWGAFGAVGFVEGGAGASWHSADGALRVEGEGSRRHYLNTDAEVAFAPLRANGWALNASGAVRLAPRWTLDAQYGLDLGFGAAESQGALRLARTLSGGNSFGLSATAFQTADELRVSSGTVVGIGLDGGLRLGERSRLTGSFFDYRHIGAVPESGPNWSQLRGSVSFSWTVGAEPGLPAPGGR